MEDMMPEKEPFQPNWCEEPAPERSYRSLFKYGDPKAFKHPNSGLYKLLKETFGMTDADFQQPSLCTETVDVAVPQQLAEQHLRQLTALVGADNVRV